MRACDVDCGLREALRGVLSFAMVRRSARPAQSDARGGRRCATLVCSVALALLAADRGAAQSLPGVSVQAPPAGEASAPVEQEAADSLTLGAGIAFGVLNLPKVGAGATLMAHVRPRRFVPIELAAVYFFENDDELTLRERDLHVSPLVGVPFPPSGTRTGFRAAELKAALCPLEHALRSGGLLDARAETGPLFAFEAYARWRFRLVERMGLSYSAGLFVPMIRERFGYTDSRGGYREQFRIAPVGGRLDAALTYTF
jgi:hypothetical protein